ncbi:MAG: YifB family Mg chelatase-like AAA ATPase [Rickettsiales bacterium]|jgi:magnesium chelatase family protein|nr:YifB family Mg chelatase-like AAA ATPase [Rickettsiales bacterium]
MLAKVITSAFNGIDVIQVSVEVMISPGLPKFVIVGLPDKAISEAKERISSAFTAMGFSLPAKRIIVNLAPADVLKEGSHFDLPIAMAILAALNIVPAEETAGYMMLGELSLDGGIKPVSGILPAAVGAASAGLGIVCPERQAHEAMWAGNRALLAASNLLELVNHFRGQQIIALPSEPMAFEEKYPVDMSDIKGQQTARRALEIAAAGGHHLLMIGPPGVGKSMLAQRLPTILPPMSAKEALDVSIINSISGVPMEHGLRLTRPFRSPHHTASQAALTGGGMRAKPGEVSLAHNGILFLDELPEFASSALDSLRQPLENGVISIARANGHITYPAKFQLVAAMNPCKCGHFRDPAKACSSAPICALKYQNRISGPIYDRIDLCVGVENVNPWELEKMSASESSSDIRERVLAARTFQSDRLEKFYGEKGLSNARLSGRQIEESGAFEAEAMELLVKSCEKLGLSARGYYKIMRIARTIADMAAQPCATRYDIAEAMMFRRRTEGQI